MGLCCAAGCVLILLAAIPAFCNGSRIGLFFSGCDSFCYSQMADAIRDARAAGRPVDYFLEDEQTRSLVATLRESGLPEDQWRQVVGPHGFYYFTGSGYVGPQYPPGAPWTLSWFPKWSAIRWLNACSVLCLAVGGWALVAHCARRQLPYSCLVAGFASSSCVAVFNWISLASFSINATAVPLCGAVFLAWMAHTPSGRGPAVLFALLSGILLGQVLQDRVASLLLLPTLLLFSCRVARRN